VCERKDDAVDPRFAVLVEALAPKLDELLARVPLQYGNLPRDMPFSGVYLFSEGARHLYVGRSNSLRGRYGHHCRPGATHRQAAFAFRLAREATGKTVATYRAGEGSRAGLMDELLEELAATPLDANSSKWIVDMNLPRIVPMSRRSAPDQLVAPGAVSDRTPIAIPCETIKSIAFSGVQLGLAHPEGSPPCSGSASAQNGGTTCWWTSMRPVLIAFDS
jgi:hypothetical protein